MHQYFKYVIRGHGSINCQGDFIKDLSRTQVSMYKACALRTKLLGNDLMQSVDLISGGFFLSMLTHHCKMFEGTRF